MGKRKGMLYEALQRLDSLMAIGEKRSEAKATARARGASIYAFTDGKIHSYGTRSTYQAVVMRFLHWCRATSGFNRLAQIDARADELVSAYLVQHIAENKSAWTLQTERSALRCFFQSRDLAASVDLPKRRLRDITRSRLPAKRDRNIQLDHWQPIIRFCAASGLRREEARDVLIGDIVKQRDGTLVVIVRRGKGGKRRYAPVLHGREQDILDALGERTQRVERVFAHVPSNLEVQPFRRAYARALYEQCSGEPLPANEGASLTPLNQACLLKVSRALGHNRRDVLTYYLWDHSGAPRAE